MLLLIYFPLFVGVLRLSLFWYALICILSSYGCFYCCMAVLLQVMFCGSSSRCRGLICSDWSYSLVYKMLMHILTNIHAYSTDLSLSNREQRRHKIKECQYQAHLSLLAFVLYESLIGPRREKTCLRGVANNTCADQPAHPRSLISAFVVSFFGKWHMLTCYR